jgi:transcriptional regulator NrdR family protein
MNCPKCSKATSVIDSRKKEAGVRRRRVCECGERFTTNEVIVQLKKGVYERKLIQPLSMSQSANGNWTISVDKNTPEWAKKMLMNL